ncbi:interleukin-1 receptor-associated kinase 3 [Discoglossus pictus]
MIVRCTMAAPGVSLSSDMYLFEVPPATMEMFCKLMDCCDGDLGWRGLAERLSSDWMEFRKVEKYAEQGKSRTRELLWSWAQKNKTVGDLLIILQDMGHERAVHLFISQGVNLVCVHMRNDSLVERKTPTLENCGVHLVECVSAPGAPGSLHEEKNSLPPLNFKMIKEGTKDFHEDLLIKEGRFFDVYKAELRSQMCVVRVLKEEKNVADQKQWKLFISELKRLPRFKHPNILELLGYFSSEERTCLVYPYLINGSLHNRIHCADNSPPLSWQVRYRILVGVARAIQYLHAVQPSSVVCGNITSKNILLDQHFEPKLSDFAMVHLRSYLINHIYTIKMDHATLKFLGYLPEEYIRRGNLSTKTDVYSYGVLMMELLTGCSVVLNGCKYVYLRDVLCDMVEKSGVESLHLFLDKKADTWPQNVAEMLLNLAVQCTASRVKVRPTMEDVVGRIEASMHAHYEDQPKSLKLVQPSHYPETLCSPFNIPEESDESQDYLSSLHRKRPHESPCECSQSEVTYLGATRKRGESVTAGKYNPSGTQNTPSGSDYLKQMPELSYASRPSECSCSSESDSTVSCDECVANGFGHCPSKGS